MPHTKQAESAAKGRYTSLCRPDDEKSCFRCCPPIRPLHYDHLDHRSFLRREFMDNTHRLKANPASLHPITGFCCWGLGYVDQRHIGCLLHPFQNQGRDLRDLTGYGDKCRREICLEASAFSRLTEKEARWIIQLTGGLDSFEYSSPKTNPVFRLLRWGPAVIHRLANLYTTLDRRNYHNIWERPVAGLTPETHRFPMEICLEWIELPSLLQPDVLAQFQETVSGFINHHRSPLTPPLDNRPFVHQLDIPDAFGLFLKFALKKNRLRPSQARGILDDLLDRMEKWAMTLPPRADDKCPLVKAGAADHQ